MGSGAVSLRGELLLQQQSPSGGGRSLLPAGPAGLVPAGQVVGAACSDDLSRLGSSKASRLKP